MSKGHGSRIIGMIIVLALALMGVVYLGASISELSRRGFEFVMVAVLGGLGLAYLLFRGPVGKAIAALLEGDPRPDDDLAFRVEDLEARLSELSLEQQRIMELEDRLEFTERLLAAREPGAIEGGTS